MAKLATLAAAGIICAAMFSGAAAQTAAPLKVYAAGEITPDRYTVVRRLWVDDWRSAFRIPSDAQSGAAIESIVNAAARSGADGVVNLQCLENRGGFAGDGSFLCYALAIKLKP